MLQVNGFATILWIVIAIFIEAVFLIVFNIVPRATYTVSPTVEEFVVPPQNEAVTGPKPDDSPILIISSAEIGGEDITAANNADISSGEIIKAISIFSIGLEETIFHDVINSTVYLTSTSDEILRSVKVTAFNGNPMDYVNASTIFDKSLPLSDFTAEIINVPVTMFTNISSRAVGGIQVRISTVITTLTTLHIRTMKVVAQFSKFTLVYICMSLFFVAMALCFYLPGVMDYQVQGAAGAQLGTKLTTAVFTLTLATLLGQICSAVLETWYSPVSTGADSDPVTSAYQSRQRRGAWVSLFFIIICLALSAELLSLVVNNQSLTSYTSHHNGPAVFFEEFNCGCPSKYEAYQIPISPSPSYSPTGMVSSKPTSVSHIYTFECTAEEFAQAGYDSCAMNCGTCGSTYRKTFLAFVSVGFLELLILMTLAHARYFWKPVCIVANPPGNGPEIETKTLVTKHVSKVGTATHMEVTIHGSISIWLSCPGTHDLG